jgi:tetratricopeptide (TPR) repeat protein
MHPIRTTRLSRSHKAAAGSALVFSLSVGWVLSLTLAHAQVWDGCDQIYDPERTVAVCSAQLEDPQTQPNDRVTALINRAIAFGELEQSDRALQDYETAEQLSPDDFRIYYNRSAQYGRLGRTSDQLNDADELVRLRPDNHASYIRRGAHLFLADEFELALQDFETAIRLSPENPLGYDGRAGVLSVQQGDLDEWMREYEIVQTLDPANLIGSVFSACRPGHEVSALHFLLWRIEPASLGYELTVSYLSDIGYDLSGGEESIRLVLQSFIY